MQIEEKGKVAEVRELPETDITGVTCYTRVIHHCNLSIRISPLSKCFKE